MKHTLAFLLVSTVLVCHGQAYDHTFTREIAFPENTSDPVFILTNINGSISAEAYDGTTVQLEARLNIRAKTDALLDKAKEGIDLGVLDRQDTMVVFVQTPCNEFEWQRDSRHRNGNHHWGYSWEDCKEYGDYTLDFTLKVPRGMRTWLSTVNKGDIDIRDVQGELVVENINGSITIEGGGGLVSAHTINGDVTLSYVRPPQQNSSFYTLNGDIQAYFPDPFRANVTFKSFNGEIFTDFNQVETQPMLLTSEKTSKKSGIAYRMEARSLISFGGGGDQLNFETFNGNVYIHQKK